MAVTYPGAQYRQLSGKSRQTLDPRVINIHTMVGTLAGTESWFSPAGRSYSHFGVGGSGEVRQWQDLAFKAASDLDGNGFCISFECEDHGQHFPSWDGSDVPGFTDAQIEALVDAIAWCCRKFKIPPKLLKDSKPGQTGISYHRLGINPWRIAGGVRYSSKDGKACPGDNRIKQIKTIIVPRVAAVLGQGDGLIMDNDVRQAFEDVKNALRPHVDGTFANRVRDSLARLEARKVTRPAYLAVDSDWDSEVEAERDAARLFGVHYVAADHQSKLKLTTDGPLHTWLKDLEVLSGGTDNATRVDREILDQIPTVGA